MKSTDWAVVSLCVVLVAWACWFTGLLQMLWDLVLLLLGLQHH